MFNDFLTLSDDICSALWYLYSALSFTNSAFLQNSPFFWLHRRLHGHLRGLKIQEDSPWWRKEKSRVQLKFIITFNKQNTIHYYSQQYYIVQLQRFSLSIDCMAVWLLCSCCSWQPFLILFLRALKIDRNMYTKTFKISEIKRSPNCPDEQHKQHSKQTMWWLQSTQFLDLTFLSLKNSLSSKHELECGIHMVKRYVNRARP